MGSRPRFWPVGLVLLAIGCGKSTTHWAEQAQSEDPAVRLRAIHALQERRQDKDVVLPVLMSALKDENSYVRRDAARALGLLGPEAEEAIPPLVILLRDKEPSVRKAATSALKSVRKK